MKKCLCCSKQKLFMSLQEGLCPDCYKAFQKCQENYRNLLSQVTSPTTNLQELTAAINLLMIELRKYDNISNSIKSSDCLELQKIANSVHNLASTTEVVKEDSFTETPFDLSEEVTSVEENIDLASENVAPLNTVTNMVENKPLLDDTPDTKLSVPISSNEIPLITEEIPSSDELIKNINADLYDEAKNLVNTMVNDKLSIDELCYYTFLLKNNYLAALKKYNITEIDDLNIESLIDSNLKKCSLATNCPVENLYAYYNYIAFSIQTTGIKLQSNSIIELAALKIKYGQIEDTFHTLINPQKTISLATEKSTGITNEQLITAPTMEVVLKDFVDFTDNLTLISHNSNYNFGFLTYNYLKLFGKELSLNHLCTMKLFRTRYKNFHGEPPNKFDLIFCCDDILSSEDINLIGDNPSIAYSSAVATYKLYEVIKNRYK